MLHYNKPLKRSQPYIKAHKHVQGRNEDHARRIHAQETLLPVLLQVR